jgi:hypothetical protein
LHRARAAEAGLSSNGSRATIAVVTLAPGRAAAATFDEELIMRTLMMLRAWWPWVVFSGAVLLLAFSTLDPIVIGALALIAIGVFALRALREARTDGGSPARKLLRSLTPGLGLLLILAAGGAEAEVPENATAKYSGSGWTCDPGFSKSGEACLPVSVPDNAHATRGRYGRGWDCGHGFREEDERCLPVRIPANAYLDASGTGWSCNRGFRKEDDGCVAILVPENGFLVGGAYGPGWECERGFRPVDDTCQAIAVPENGYLSESASSKRGWECERGYLPEKDSCRKIEVPENAFLAVSSRYGDGWECERGFVKSGDECLIVEVPEHAHLRYDGSSWECDKPFLERHGSCVAR